jgi:lipoyl-dependent peroxiredoxin
MEHFLELPTFRVAMRLDREIARSLVDAAHQNTCPYSNATRGNIDVTIALV